MFETNSEQQSTQQNNSSTNALVTPESLVDHHHHTHIGHAPALSMLSSYYYCTANFLDLKHHNHYQTNHQHHHHYDYNYDYAQFMPPTAQLIPTVTPMADDIKLERLKSLAEPPKPTTKKMHRLFRKRTSKRLDTSSSTGTSKKPTGLSKLKALLFKTCRTVTARNRLRYQRPHRYSKSASLSPTSPSSNSSSSSSSCSSSNSPELNASLSTNTITKKKMDHNNTYKRFRKIRNRLLKCNVQELINEDEDEDEGVVIPLESIETTIVEDPTCKESSSEYVSQLITLQPSISTYPLTHEHEQFTETNYHNHTIAQQQFSYDVDMLAPSTLETEEVIEEQVFSSNSDTSTSDPVITVQQCQIKQDLLKLSYEKFKQFRLNEKLLQQTVLIRNAIKMLQYDIQYQQEQEQMLVQQKIESQQRVETSNTSRLEYSESIRTEMIHHNHHQPSPVTINSSPDYLPSPQPCPVTYNPSLDPSTTTPTNTTTTTNCGFKNPNANPMLNGSAAYDNLDEFINNHNILHLNNNQPTKNSFERPKSKCVEVELDELSDQELTDEDSDQESDNDDNDVNNNKNLRDSKSTTASTNSENEFNERNEMASLLFRHDR